MEKRALGNTGISLSIVGFGGIVVMNVEAADAERYVGQAYDRGINYFDVAPTYGNAQERLGPALKPYRDEVFLACKTADRTKAGAEMELHQSLKMLRTDHFDLYQLHGMTTIAEVEKVFEPDGAIHALIEARRKGDVRLLGFSAHSEEAALALLERFKFDTILFPVNWAAWLANDFGPAVVKKAQANGTAVLALKSLCRRALGKGEPNPWKKAWYSPVETYEEAELALRFTLSQPVVAAVSPGHYEFYEWAAEAAEHFRPIREDEVELLRERAAQVEPLFPVEKK
jgi:aryl-alcohol dehydrogenase-like predicted oxidoreductase